MLALGRVAERFGKRPSEMLRGRMEDLILDMFVARELAREESRRWREFRR
ncbi:MAG: hypothetical protein NZ988_06235 [Thaumarchaeota archaeon]|nr:hypothetical protein [Candidatus Calditenuaceae archaeon]MDW8187621.1 hypothetical protein [Nitrososphaerota archaeon]